MLRLLQQTSSSTPTAAVAASSRRIATSAFRKSDNFSGPGFGNVGGLRPKRDEGASKPNLVDQRQDPSGAPKTKAWFWSRESPTPKIVPESEGALAIGTSPFHSAFATSDKLYTFGANQSSQLGRQNSTGPAPDGWHLDLPMPVDQPLLGQVARLSLGHQTTHAITTDMKVWSWGHGGTFWRGSTGLGHGDTKSRSVPTLVEGVPGVIDAASGERHNLVLCQDGRVFVSGNGDFGALGIGEVLDAADYKVLEYFSRDPEVMGQQLPNGVVKISAGQNFSGALTRQGQLFLWGHNGSGQLGLGLGQCLYEVFTRYPQPISDPFSRQGINIVDFACGDTHTVVLTESGVVYDWGMTLFVEPRSVTVASAWEAGIKNPQAVAAGDDWSTLHTADGKLYVWGRPESGCLLGTEQETEVTSPTQVDPALFDNEAVVEVVCCGQQAMVLTRSDLPPVPQIQTP